MFTFEIDSENALVDCTLERWRGTLFSVPISEDLKSIKNSLGGHLPLVPFLKLPNPNAKCAPRCCGAPGAHQQSGQCIYITNMQNLNIALFYILILEFADYFAYCKIYMHNNMYNMQNNMQKNRAMFRFCIFCILQYAKYAEYVK